MYFVFLIYNTTQILCTDLPLVEKKNLPNIFTYHHNMTHYKHFPEIHVKLGILGFSDIFKGTVNLFMPKGYVLIDVYWLNFYYWAC